MLILRGEARSVWMTMGLVVAGATASLPVCAQPRIDRIVAVGGSVTEMVYALGAGEQLVAVDSTSVYPKSALKLPKVGYMRALAAEGVLSLGPQLVLATSEAGPKAAIAQLKSAGVNVVSLPADHTVAGVRSNIRLVATTLGIEKQGARLVETFDAEWAATSRAVAAMPGKPRVLFLLAHTGNNIMVAGTDTAAESMIRLAGGINAIDSFQGYKSLTAEAAIATAPDVILITTEGLAALGGADRLWDKTGLALSNAGKRKRYVALDALALLGFGPRLPQAVRELAERLHQP